MPAVFIAQHLLDQWTDEGKVQLDGTVLTLLDERRTVELIPAARFTKLIDDGDDPHKLLGKVKTVEQIVALGGEHFHDSVIVGDIGYTVVPGFMGDLSPAPRRQAATLTPAHVPAPAAAAPPTSSLNASVRPAPVAGVASDTEAAELSQLFLKTVPDR